MSLYRPLESADGHRLQHIAEVKFRLEKERNFRASLYKKYKHGVNKVDGIESALATASAGLAASGIGLLSTIIVVPVAIGIQAGAVVCGLLGAGGKLIGRQLQAKAKKHNQIRVLADTKLNTIADHVSAALADDKIHDEEFRLILSEVDKNNQMKEEIRGRQKEGIGLSEAEKTSRSGKGEKRRWLQPVPSSKLAPLLKHFLLAGVKTQSGQDRSIRIRINRAGEPL